MIAAGSGAISRDPVVVEAGPAPIDRTVRWMALGLIVVLVLADPVLFGNLVCLGVVAVAVGWVCRRAGLGSPGRGLVAGAALTAGVLRRHRNPMLRMAVADQFGERLVFLRGDHTGAFERGDVVTVHAVRSTRGVLHAMRIRNHHNGITCWRPGLIRLAAWAALDLWLLASILTHWS